MLLATFWAGSCSGRPNVPNSFLEGLDKMGPLIVGSSVIRPTFERTVVIVETLVGSMLVWGRVMYRMYPSTYLELRKHNSKMISFH